MSVLIILLIAFVGLLIFAGGIIFGARVFTEKHDDGESTQFREAINLWRSDSEAIEELTRRNVVELGSVRERLSDLESSIRDSHIIDTIDALTKQICQSEGGGADCSFNSI